MLVDSQATDRQKHNDDRDWIQQADMEHNWNEQNVQQIWTKFIFDSVFKLQYLKSEFCLKTKPIGLKCVNYTEIKWI